jgi:HAE1 family hydrophobic/amphiphilic exporter-1
MGGMLVGTLFGVLVIPGLYYAFATLGGGRKLLKDESDEPLSEEYFHDKEQQHKPVKKKNLLTKLIKRKKR